jgi:hypothetical protein
VMSSSAERTAGQSMPSSAPRSAPAMSQPLRRGRSR